MFVIALFYLLWSVEMKVPEAANTEPVQILFAKRTKIMAECLPLVTGNGLTLFLLLRLALLVLHETSRKHSVMGLETRVEPDNELLKFVV